jgi:DNA primase
MTLPFLTPAPDFDPWFERRWPHLSQRKLRISLSNPGIGSRWGDVWDSGPSRFGLVWQRLSHRYDPMSANPAQTRHTARNLRQVMRRGDRFARLRLLPIYEVAARLGVKGISKSMRCPLPGHEDRHPSFVFFHSTNTWKCFGCGRGGSPIDLVAAMLGCSIAKAADWLDCDQDLALVGVSAGHDRDRARRDTPHAKLDPDPRVYRSLLAHNPLQRQARDYLNSRGFSDETISRFQLGYLESATSTLSKLIAEFGRDRLHRAGLLSNRRAARLALPSNSIVFPFLKGAEIVYLQCRLMPEAEGPRWMGLAGLKKPVFNLDVVERAKTLYVCEGATDVLSAHELGLCAIGLLGSASRAPMELLQALVGKTVYVTPDNDPAGEAMLRVFKADLEAAGGQAFEKRVPEGRDLNDYLIAMRRRANA